MPPLPTDRGPAPLRSTGRICNRGGRPAGIFGYASAICGSPPN